MDNDDFNEDTTYETTTVQRQPAFIFATGFSDNTPFKDYVEPFRFGSTLKRVVSDLFFGDLHVRAMFVLPVAAVIGGVAYSKHRPQTQDETLDMVVVTFIFSMWFVFCVPSLLATFTLGLAKTVVTFFFELYFADAAAMSYAFYRGHSNLLRRGFSLLPTLEANRSGRGLAWLGEAGYSLRLAFIVCSCIMGGLTACIKAWAGC